MGKLGEEWDALGKFDRKYVGEGTGRELKRAGHSNLNPGTIKWKRLPLGFDLRRYNPGSKQGWGVLCYVMSEKCFQHGGERTNSSLKNASTGEGGNWRGKKKSLAGGGSKSNPQ